MHVLGVEYTYKKQTACPGQFAGVVLDFEPADAYTFVNALPADALEYPDSQARFVPVIDETAREQLETCFGAGPLPVRVTLRAARDHPVDTRETSFRAATIWAVRKALGGSWADHRAEFSQELEEIPPSARHARLRSLLDDPRRCFEALELCRDLVHDTPHELVALLPAIAELVGSPDERVALRAVRVLADAPRDRTRDLIAGALSRPAGQARDQAARILAERGRS